MRQCASTPRRNRRRGQQRHDGFDPGPGLRAAVTSTILFTDIVGSTGDSRQPATIEVWPEVSSTSARSVTSSAASVAG
jgi:hypothetical protein